MEKTYEYIFSKIPDSIDFGFITVKSESVRSFIMDNTSQMSILFKIENAEGYVFEPNNGVIPKGKKLEVKVKIFPQEATVLVANARILLDNKKSKIIKMSSIAKYPYLRINVSSLDFGTVQIGKSVEGSLIITNPESVPAKFTITKDSSQPGKHPENFAFKSFSGEVPPNQSYLLKISYKPFFPNLTSNDIYYLKTQGGNTCSFILSGNCESLKTWLGAKRVSFKSIPLGSQMTKLIRIYNDGTIPTEYQIFHDNSGAFIINNTQGLIPPHSNLRINVTFRPYETLLYYQRVYCLIKNHILIPLDLYGSCHDLLVKAPQLEQKMIDIFRLKMLRGFFFGKNAKGEKENELIERATKTSILKSTIKDGLTSASDDGIIDFTSQIQLHKELFWEYTSKTRIISFDTDHIDFNYVEVGKVSEPFILHVSNNSVENVKVKWIYDKPINTSNLLKEINIFNVESTVFFVQPEEKIIPRGGTAEFKVFFKPNKHEFYFYTDLPLMGTIIKQKNLNISTSLQGEGLSKINKDRLTDTGRGIATQSIDFGATSLAPKTPIVFKSSLMKSLAISKKQSIMQGEKKFEYFDPPFVIKLSMVGHTFPPGTQIFMPIYEMTPKRELFFPSGSLNQSLYQTLKIQNKSDTPLYYKLSTDPLGVFKIHRKYGLIPANEFHLICVEFCPKDTTVYRFPLRIVLNHDTANMKTVILNGLCTDPVIKIEGIRNELYFPPSYVGIKTKKAIVVKNISPIKISVSIRIVQNENATVEVNPSEFEMDVNMERKIEISMTPKHNDEIMSSIFFTAERCYDPLSEEIGIYNPASTQLMKSIDTFDKRKFEREIVLLGRGNDGDVTVEPQLLEFGTVKVGFHKKLTFSIFNPTITNFYIKVVPEMETTAQEKYKDMIKFDFSEGLINSFCRKDVGVTFNPRTRVNLSVKVNIYATNNQEKENEKTSDEEGSLTQRPVLKCFLVLKANGDYPLIKIVDLRNSKVSTDTLWTNFNVNEVNEELQKKLSDEELNYMSDSKTNKKIQEIREQLRCIKFDFGKHVLSSTRTHNYFDVFLTLKNEGGVTSEFFFKFPDDIAIKREIWMDPVEPTSNDKVEYHVLKEKIFEVEPRKSKLDPNETCNIWFRYNIKEKGDHRLRLIFQIVNGKPLVFELHAESILDKIGVLDIPNPVLDFHYISIGYMNYIASPIELRNNGAVKVKYYIDPEEIEKFNLQNGDMKIFKIDNTEGVINANDKKFIVAYFRPNTDADYVMNLTIHYTDDVSIYNKQFTVKGHGYHPFKFTPELPESPYKEIPKAPVCNLYKGNPIQKCGFSLEELDFGELKDKSRNKTLILYNFSMTNSFNFEFIEPGFLVEDELYIQPSKGTLEPNSHKIIKVILTQRGQPSQYEGDLQVNITWNSLLNTASVNPLVSIGKSQMTVNTNRTLEKENLYIRIRKLCSMRDTPGLIEPTNNPNGCFVETMLMDLTREILCDKEFEELFTENIDNQPLGLYPWTTDVSFPTQEEVREKIFKDIREIAIPKPIEPMMSPSYRKGNTPRTTLINHRYQSNQQTSSQVSAFTLEVNKVAEKEKEKEKEKKEAYDQEVDYAIQDKYMHEMIDKYKLTIPELNEKLIVVNEETRNVISNTIMENTVYNLISEAVYGESDLTEKPRIYFFVNKNS